MLIETRISVNLNNGCYCISADLSKSLSELGLLNRQALIVVPNQRAGGDYRGASSSSDRTNLTNVDSSDGTNGGPFAYARRILSYMNPFSYIGGGASSSSSGQESQNGIWQYSEFPYFPVPILCYWF